MFSSVRSGPESTWQCMQVILQSLPRLICTISRRSGFRRGHPEAARSSPNRPLLVGPPVISAASRTLSCSSGCTNGIALDFSEDVARGPSAASCDDSIVSSDIILLCSTHSKLHRYTFDLIEHLYAVYKRCSPSDCCSYMDGLSHLL